MAVEAARTWSPAACGSWSSAWPARPRPSRWRRSRASSTPGRRRHGADGGRRGAAVDAGAAFLISPGLAPEVAAWARDRDLLHIPGAFSPTEVIAAAIPLVKLFPAAGSAPPTWPTCSGRFRRAPRADGWRRRHQRFGLPRGRCRRGGGREQPRQPGERGRPAPSRPPPSASARRLSLTEECIVHRGNSPRNPHPVPRRRVRPPELRALLEHMTRASTASSCSAARARRRR